MQNYEITEPDGRSYVVQLDEDEAKRRGLAAAKAAPAKARKATSNKARKTTANKAK